MSFEFRLPSLEEMRATPSGIEMLQLIDDDGFRSALVTGCPGSGKTTLLVYRLIRLASQGKKVQLLTFQKLLALAIQNLIRQHSVHPRLVSTFQRWLYAATGEPFNCDRPPAAEQLAEQLEAWSLSREADELLIDEGQDLPLCVYRTLPAYFGRTVVGVDNCQQVHTHGAVSEHIQELFQVHFPPFLRVHLTRNFRNTYETYKFARQFIPRANTAAWDEDILTHLKRARKVGRKPLIVSYKNPSQRNEHIRTTLANADGNVAILCPLGRQGQYAGASGESVEEMYDVVKKMGFPASAYYSEKPLPERLERYLVTTFKSAKGLDFDVVVIPRINFFKRIPQEWFVACTRAIGRLIIYRDSAKPQCDPFCPPPSAPPFDPDTYEMRSLDGESKPPPQPDFSDLPF